MAELAGVRIRDASNNPLTDASAAYLTDRNIDVYVGGGGILYAANQGIADDILKWLKDNFGDAADFMDWVTTLVRSMAEWAVLNAIAANLEKYWKNNSPDTVSYQGSDYTYTGWTVNGILTAIAGIDPGGGLTEEEHNQLMALLNLSQADVYEAVWTLGPEQDGIASTSTGHTTLQQLMESFGILLAQQGYQGIAHPLNPYVNVVSICGAFYNAPGGQWDDWGEEQIPPVPDWSLWQDGDTPVSFLLRTQPDFGWDDHGPFELTSTMVAWAPAPGTTGWTWYRSNWTSPPINATTTEVLIPSVGVEVTAAPLWPGLANVTLGTPVALVDNLTINETMDGVIIAVTTPPSATGRFRLGGHYFDYGSGRIAFGNDAGDLETWQYLGFRAAIFTPKTMQHASSVHLQVLAGAEGTVTPWTVS